MTTEADRRVWRSARTLDDLGVLTARWLEGDLRYHPGNLGGPDDETYDLVPVLAAANRGGFLTTSSQPGYTGPASRQRAFVQGFVAQETLDRLMASAVRCDVIVIAHHLRRGHVPQVVTASGYDRDALPRGFAVAEVDGDTTISLGRRPGWFFEESGDFLPCKRAVRRQLRDMHQVTVIDHKWGRNDRLWDTLTAVFGAAEPVNPVYNRDLDRPGPAWLAECQRYAGNAFGVTALVVAAALAFGMAQFVAVVPAVWVLGVAWAALTGARAVAVVAGWIRAWRRQP